MQTFAIKKIFIQGPDYITLTHEDLKEQLVFAKANNVEGFTIGSDLKNPPYPDLSFLPADTIRGIFMTFQDVHDLSLINNFHQLEVLGNGWMSYPHMDIDLANFPKMRVLNINWNKHYRSLNQLLNVVRMSIWKYKPKSRDLEELRNWNKLAYATLTQPGVDTLDGIEDLKRLKELSLRNVRSLKRFFSDEREARFPLEILECSSCPHLDLDSIPPLPTLKTLRFDKVGKKETLRHLLKKLPSLESVSFIDSELIDGNLDYLLEHPSLKSVFLIDKKHYSMKDKEIQKFLDEKNNTTK